MQFPSLTRVRPVARNVSALVPPRPREGLRRPLVSRGVAMRATSHKMEPDTKGAQHTGFHMGHSDLSHDKLSYTIAGTYEWQLFYLFLAASFLLLPFFPGFTSFAQAVYEGVWFGGKLL